MHARAVQAMLNRLLEEDGLRPIYRQLRDAEHTHLASPFVSENTSAAAPGVSAPMAALSPNLGRPLALDVSEGDSATGDTAMRPSAALQEAALVFTMRAVRYGLFYGDDGHSVQVLSLAYLLRRPDAVLLFDHVVRSRVFAELPYAVTSRAHLVSD